MPRNYKKEMEWEKSKYERFVAKIDKELGLKFTKVSGGTTTVYDGCVVCNENTDEITASGIALKANRKIVAKHIGSNAFELGDWVYIEGWGYALVADTGGFYKESDPYHLDCFVGREGDIVTDGASHGGAGDELCLNQKNTPACGVKTYEREPGNLENIDIYIIKPEDIPSELLNGELDTVVTSDDDSNSNKNDNTDLGSVSDTSEFNEKDNDYYGILELDSEINRVDIINSKPSKYLEYLKKGTQYSNHVGYSRAYLTFAYSTLRRLFDDYFGETKTVPFAYGVSLGYQTYTESNELNAGSYNQYDISTGNSSNVIEGNIPTIPGSVQVPSGLGLVHTWTIWNHVNEDTNPESTWPEGTEQANLILYLTNNNERSLHGELAGNITANSKHMVCYGEWLATAMVSELGGTQGNPEKRLKVGDFVFIIQDNGTFYPVILTDTKVQFTPTTWDSTPANEWGHDNGECMVEFQGYTSSWQVVPDSPSEFNHYISQVYLVGNVYEDTNGYLNDLDKAAKDAGLDPQNMIRPKSM